MRVRAAILAAMLALAPPAAPAQEAGIPLQGQVRSPILTLVSDRLFEETLLGQRIEADLRARADALAAENEQLQAELTAEERSLTERRPTMEVEAFRAEAEAFHARAQTIRNEQDAKQQALEQAVRDSRGTFIGAVRPVLARLMIDSGAAVILEQRQVVLSASVIDITDEAIAAIDAELGDGTDASESVAPEEVTPSPSDNREAPTAPDAADPPEAAPADGGGTDSSTPDVDGG